MNLWKETAEVLTSHNKDFDKDERTLWCSQEDFDKKEDETCKYNKVEIKRNKIKYTSKSIDTNMPYPPYNLCCPSCGADTGWSSGPIGIVLTEDVKCPKCGEVVIRANNITC